MKIRLSLPAVACLALLSTGPALAQPRESLARQVARGQYLVTVMDCRGCHTPGALAGKPDPNRALASSGIGFGGPFGVVYPKNLTPDKDTGLDNWTDTEIGRAIRQGVSRSGAVLNPIMPWPSYSALTPGDLRAIVASLRSVPAVRFAAPANVAPGDRVTAPYLGVIWP